MKKHPWNPTVGGEERIQKDRQLWKRNLGMNTDTELVQCGVCKGKFKKGGLKIHQTKAGCAKQLSDPHRNKNKSEATSTQDTNHSDASGRVSLNTTRRGNGTQVTGAMEDLYKVTKEIIIKKMVGETCNEEGMVAKEKVSRLKNTKIREEKTDIRNWFKKKERLKKENIHQVKSEEDIDQIKPEEYTVSEVEIIDLTEEITPSENKEEEMAEPGKERVGAAVIDLEKVGTASSRQENVKEKVDIQKGPEDEYLNEQLYLRRRDFQSLSGTRYLLDNIIDKYLQLICERNEADSSLPGIYTCITHLYTATVMRGIRLTVRWVKEDLRMKDLIFFPIHNERMVHWSLIAVETSTKTVNYFDSLERERIFSPAPKIIKQFMEMHYKDRGETVTFKIKRRQDAPLQENGYDCGVFVCQYVERIARRSPLNFSQKDLDLACARERMTQELLEGRINPDWRMVNWVKEVWKNQKNRNENKGKENGITRTVEKQYHCGKQKENGIRSSAGKLGAKKKDSSQKETPKATSKGSKLEGEERRKEIINWPKANSKEWIRFDEDVTNILKVVHSSYENKAEAHPGIIFTVGNDRFGAKEAKQKTQSSGPSKRQKKCKTVREEIKQLKKNLQKCPRRRERSN